MSDILEPAAAPPNTTAVDWNALDAQLATTGDIDAPEKAKPAKKAGKTEEKPKEPETEATEAPEKPLEQQQQLVDESHQDADKIEENQQSETDEETEPDDTDQHGEQIDYELEIPIAGEDSVTLSVLKDEYQQRAQLQAQFLKEKNDFANERVGLAELVQMLEPTLNPQQMAAVKQQRARTLHVEHEKLLASFPQWSDATVKQNDSKAMRELCAEYGITEREFRSVGDHRMIRVLHDFADMLRKVRKPVSPERVKRKRMVVRGPRRSRRGASTDKMVAAAASSNDRGVKQAAIDQLLR